MYKMQKHIDRVVSINRFISEIKNDVSLSLKEKTDYLNLRGITINGEPLKEENFFKKWDINIIYFIKTKQIPTGLPKSIITKSQHIYHIFLLNYYLI